MTEPTYTIRVCYDVKGWAYYRRACALQKYAPDDFHVTIGPDYGKAFKSRKHDLVLQLCYSYAKDLRRHLDANRYDTILVSSFNVGRGYANRWFRECAQWSDHVVINSRSCWEGLGKPPNTTWISNGVDRELFPLQIPPAQRSPRVLWTGSQVHRATKRYDDLLMPVADRLHAYGIATDFRLVDSHGGITRRNQVEMAQWYNTGTTYVVASRSEGTPNPALEAASAGCVVVSTAVGNMPELIDDGVNGRIANGNVNELLSAIIECQSRYPEMARAMQNRIASWHWQLRAEEYFKLFRKLIDARRTSTTPVSKSSVSKSSVSKAFCTAKPRSAYGSSSSDTGYTIVTCFSSDYLPAFHLVRDSWLRTNASRIVAYTDFELESSDDRIVVRKHFDPTNDWIENVGRKVTAVRHYLEHDRPQRLVFLDVDCLVNDDISSVFSRPFDIAVTRLFSNERYTGGTASCGVWFANVSERMHRFVGEWETLAEAYRSAGKGVTPRKIAYDQYAFNDLVRRYYERQEMTVQPLDERVYNCEHSCVATWQQYAAEHKPKIIHFKGGRFRDDRFVKRILQLAQSTSAPPCPAQSPMSADRLKRFGSHLPLLRALLDHDCRDVIVECGMGTASTPFFASRAERALISIEHDASWYGQINGHFRDNPRWFGRLVRVGEGIDATTRLRTATAAQIQEMDRVFSSIHNDLKRWGGVDLLFVDTLSAVRLATLRHLHSLARAIVIHDTEPPNFVGYGYDRFLKDFGHEYRRYSYRPEGWPWADMLVRKGDNWSAIRDSLPKYSIEYYGEDSDFEFIECCQSVDLA